MNRHTIRPVLLVLLAASVSLAQQPALVSIRLQVEGTRAPIANAVLELTSTDSARVVKLTTDRQGRAVRGGIRPGVYSLRVECAGYRPLYISGLELKTNDRRELVLELPPAP
jgi:hypothetical protein